MYDIEGNRIAEYEFDPVANTKTLLREYIWMDGVAVAVIEGGQMYFIRTDHIGRPVFATDNTGAKVWEVSYLPFGGVHTSSGNNIALRFPGQWFQSESGLYQNWMRDYDPTTGRYMQADPLGLVDGASVYGYVRQNPGRYSDPEGLTEKSGTTRQGRVTNFSGTGVIGVNLDTKSFVPIGPRSVAPNEGAGVDWDFIIDPDTCECIKVFTNMVIVDHIIPNPLSDTKIRLHITHRPFFKIPLYGRVPEAIARHPYWGRQGYCGPFRK